MPHAERMVPGRVIASALPPGSRTAMTAHTGRIAIFSASVGAGHDGAAAELARRLTADGFAVDRHDLLDLLPAGLGPAIRTG